MAKALRWLTVLVVLGGGAGWVISAPASPDAGLAGLTGDPVAGAIAFAAAGCAACHTAPAGVTADLPLLSGGQRFVSDFGTFVAPNISPSSQGIGDWTDAQIIHAVMQGVSPDGRHYYPAFPYSAYGKAEPQDVADLVAFLRTLPHDPTPNQPHDVGFPFNIDRGIGLWKLAFVSDDWVLTDTSDAQVVRGRYLVEALGHCAECHTPRNAAGGLDSNRWLAGAPSPDGEGRIPNITPAGLSWDAGAIAYYLETGFTPEFDSVGGEMAHVVANTARLAPEDRAAIAAYLKAVPGVE